MYGNGTLLAYAMREARQTSDLLSVFGLCSRVSRWTGMARVPHSDSGDFEQSMFTCFLISLGKPKWQKNRLFTITMELVLTNWEILPTQLSAPPWQTMTKRMVALGHSSFCALKITSRETGGRAHLAKFEGIVVRSPSFGSTKCSQMKSHRLR